jgi:hypothetical protein
MLQHDDELSLSLEGLEESDLPSTAPVTPHEPLSLEWDSVRLQMELDGLPTLGQTEPSDSGKMTKEEEKEEEEPALLQELVMLPPLPSLPAATISSVLPDTFITPPKKTTSKSSTKANTTRAPRKKAASSSFSSSSSSSSSSSKTPLPLDNLIATRTVPQTAPTRRISPESISAVAAVEAVRQPARKKRRHMVQRTGTYQCLVQGELFDCPHGFDIVKKAFMYNVLGQLAGGSDQNAQ